jgi:hypothetical protein
MGDENGVLDAAAGVSLGVIVTLAGTTDAVAVCIGVEVT